MIYSLNLQCLECPQPPLKSRINGSCLCWGDTSDYLSVLLVNAKIAAGQQLWESHLQVKECLWPHKPSARSTFSQELNPPETIRALPEQHSRTRSCLSYSVLFSPHWQLFFPHWNNTVNCNAKEKKHFWMRQEENYWTLKFYFLFIELEFKSKINLGWEAFVLLAVVQSGFWHLFISTHMKI